MRVRLIPSMRRPVLSAGAVLMLAVAGTAFGVSAASGATARVPAATKVPKLSHQLCYTAAAKGFKVPTGVTLFDAFNPGGFVPKIGALGLNCNPVAKTVQSSGKTTTFPITYAAGHLACFSITEKKLKLPSFINVVNQFGKGMLFPSQPDWLCLPTWKSLVKPPHNKMAEPPYLDHFTCYPVKSQGKFVVPPLILRDEFGKSEPKVSNVPTQLCLVARKTVHGKVYKVVHPGGMLVCFPVNKTPIRNPVFDQNQFGNATVTIRQVSVLCLPSTASSTGKP